MDAFDRLRSGSLFTICYLLLLMVVLFSLSGCSDPRYLSEKLFYYAAEEVNSILKANPDQLDEKDYQDIVSAYQRIIDQCPLETLAAQAHFLISNIYLSQGNHAKAQNELQAIINNFSSNPEAAAKAQFAIGKIHEGQGKWKEAYEEYDKVIDLYPLTSLGLRVPIYFMLHYQREKDINETDKEYKKAIRHYTALIEEYEQTPFAPLVSDYLAVTYLQKGETDSAMQVWNTLVDDYPQSSQAMKSFLVKAELFIGTLKDTDKAIENYAEFVKRYPDHKMSPQILYKIGLLHVQNKNFSQAKDVFLKVIERYSEDEAASVNSYSGLAICYGQESNTDKFIDACNTVMEKYPNTRAALSTPYLIAAYYENIKYSSKAENAFKKAIDKYLKLLNQPGNGGFTKKDITGLLATCYLKTNNFDKAIDLLSKLSIEYPDDPGYLLDLAMVYIKLNNFDKSSKIYQEVVNKFPDNKRAVDFANHQIKIIKSKNK